MCVVYCYLSYYVVMMLYVIECEFYKRVTEIR